MLRRTCARSIPGDARRVLLAGNEALVALPGLELTRRVPAARVPTASASPGIRASPRWLSATSSPDTYKTAAHVLLGGTLAAKLPRRSLGAWPACGANRGSHWRYPTSDGSAVCRHFPAAAWPIRSSIRGMDKLQRVKMLEAKLCLGRRTLRPLNRRLQWAQAL